MGKLLEVKDLRTQFFTQDGVVNAVNGISYTLDEGETLGIVGESGCGKSVGVMSLIRLIPMPPGRVVGGEVWFDGRDLLTLDDDEIRQVRGNRIAMIFQDPMTSLNPVLTVGRQISEALELHMDMDKQQARQRSAELLSLVGIPGAEGRLLIADEPTTALDVTIQAQIVELVKKLRDEIGMAIIWITHDLGVVAGLADRMIVMYAGFIVEEAAVKELYANPRHPYTLGLLGSLPRLPPDLIDLPPGCPFYARCAWRIERCLQENPALEAVGPQHKAACWVDVREVTL